MAHCPGDYVCSDVFVDAVKELDIPAVQHSLIHGDALCYSIAAASIVAKVERDRYMIAAAEKFPQYGFEKTSVTEQSSIWTRFVNSVRANFTGAASSKNSCGTR